MIQRRLCQSLLAVGIEPYPRVQAVGFGAEIQLVQRSQVKAWNQGGVRRCLRIRQRLTQGMPDQIREDGAGHREGAFEDPILKLESACRILVLGVDRGLMVTADNKSCRAHDDKGPQRCDLGGAQRPLMVERRNRRQGGSGLAAFVPQHRRNRHGKFADRPRMGQVAEVDDAIGKVLGAARAAAHDVVIGDIAVNDLPRQVIGQLGDGAPGGSRCRPHQFATTVV